MNKKGFLLIAIISLMLADTFSYAESASSKQRAAEFLKALKSQEVKLDLLEPIDSTELVDALFASTRVIQKSPFDTVLHYDPGVYCVPAVKCEDPELRNYMLSYVHKGETDYERHVALYIMNAFKQPPTKEIINHVEKETNLYNALVLVRLLSTQKDPDTNNALFKAACNSQLHGMVRGRALVAALNSKTIHRDVSQFLYDDDTYVRISALQHISKKGCGDDLLAKIAAIVFDKKLSWIERITAVVAYAKTYGTGWQEEISKDKSIERAMREYIKGFTEIGVKKSYVAETNNNINIGSRVVAYFNNTIHKQAFRNQFKDKPWPFGEMCASYRDLLSAKNGEKLVRTYLDSEKIHCYSGGEYVKNTNSNICDINRWLVENDKIGTCSLEEFINLIFPCSKEPDKYREEIGCYPDTIITWSPFTTGYSGFVSMGHTRSIWSTEYMCIYAREILDCLNIKMYAITDEPAHPDSMNDHNLCLLAFMSGGEAYIYDKGKYSPARICRLVDYFRDPGE